MTKTTYVHPHTSSHSSHEIPRVLHYCWFGDPKPPLVLACIESWKRTNPSYTIKEWNEENFDVGAYPFSSARYHEKKWAFVADYVRLVVLEREGGIYLDTDMELVASLDSLLQCDLLLGEESPHVISAGMIGAVPHHPFISDARAYYDTHVHELITIPRVLTHVFAARADKVHENGAIVTLPPLAFYPYSQQEIRKYKKADLTPATYGVHLWNYSWGNPVLRVLNHYPLYKSCVKLLDAIGIKAALKRLFGMVK